MSDIDDFLRQLDALSQTSSGPFPYDGCRRLQVLSQGRHEGLIPDLDTYLSEFAGYRSWGKTILEWSDQRIETVERRLDQSFFDRFPAYVELRSILASAEAPDVNDALNVADRTRRVLLELLSAIRRSRTETGE